MSGSGGPVMGCRSVGPTSSPSLSLSLLSGPPAMSPASASSSASKGSAGILFRIFLMHFSIPRWDFLRMKLCSDPATNPYLTDLVVGMKMGTGKGSGMGTGTGKGALYILQGVGRCTGTGIGSGTLAAGPSVWVSWSVVCEAQETALLAVVGRACVPLFRMTAISPGSTTVSRTTCIPDPAGLANNRCNIFLSVVTGGCCYAGQTHLCCDAREDTAEMTGRGPEPTCCCPAPWLACSARQLREQYRLEGWSCSSAV